MAVKIVQVIPLTPFEGGRGPGRISFYFQLKSKKVGDRFSSRGEEDQGVYLSTVYFKSLER